TRHSSLVTRHSGPLNNLRNNPRAGALYWQRRPAMERKNLQPTLRDAAVADLGGPRSAEFFSRAEKLIDWGGLVGALRGLTPEQPKGGRPFWPLPLMVRCLLLQKWFGLSDPQLEEMLRDRLSFRRFVGLSLDDATPDETS